MVGLDGVSIDEPGGAGVFAENHAGLLQLGARDGMLGHLGDDLPHPRQQPAIVQGGLSRPYAVPIQVPRLPAQAGCLCQGPHRNGAVPGSHAAHLVASDQRGASPQPGRPQRRDHSGGPGADHDDIDTFRGRHGLASRGSSRGRRGSWASLLGGQAVGNGTSPSVQVVCLARVSLLGQMTRAPPRRDGAGVP